MSSGYDVIVMSSGYDVIVIGGGSPDAGQERWLAEHFAVAGGWLERA